MNISFINNVFSVNPEESAKSSLVKL